MGKSIDLHGVRHEAARQTVIHFIEDNWDTDNELEIITGNSEAMKDIVRKVAKEYKLEIGTGFGSYRNRLIVYMGG